MERKALRTTRVASFRMPCGRLEPLETLSEAARMASLLAASKGTSLMSQWWICCSNLSRKISLILTFLPTRGSWTR